EYRVDLDVVRRPGDRSALGELHDARLAGGVCGRVGGAKERRHAADVDDLAAAGLLHRRINAFRHEQRAPEIHVDDAPSTFEAHILRLIADVDASVVEQNVAPAELLRDVINNDRDLVFRADVGGDRNEFDVTFGGRPMDGRLQFFGIAADDRHASAG